MFLTDACFMFLGKGGRFWSALPNVVDAICLAVPSEYNPQKVVYTDRLIRISKAFWGASACTSVIFSETTVKRLCRSGSLIPRASPRPCRETSPPRSFGEGPSTCLGTLEQQVSGCKPETNTGHQKKTQI